MAAPRKHPPKDAAETIERMAMEGHGLPRIARELNVTTPTIKRWLEEHEALQEAYDQGRETQRHALVSVLMADAAANRSANVNAIFLLKSLHGLRDSDKAGSSNVNVQVAVAPVMVVKDHGTDEEWAAKAAEQQRKLTQECAAPQLAAPEILPPETSAEAAPELPAWMPPRTQAAVKVQTCSFDAWKPNA